VNESLGLWLVRAEGAALADALAQKLRATVYRPWLQAASQREQFAAAYRRHAQWVFIGTTGIAMRFLDGLMQGKHRDPAVVLLDEAGRHVVSLLAGHEGGANRLAYQVAKLVGAVPVVTTATEARKPLVVGIGCRKNVSAEQIESAVLHALGTRSLAEVREMATIDLKAEEPGLLAFCDWHDIPLRVFASATVAARSWVTQPSNWVRQNVGLDGVCEPCALIASVRGKLVVPKTALNGVAVAVVEDLDWITT
jgi:cobalt-precorrin 5A hydrolase